MIELHLEFKMGNTAIKVFIPHEEIEKGDAKSA